MRLSERIKELKKERKIHAQVADNAIVQLEQCTQITEPFESVAQALHACIDCLFETYESDKKATKKEIDDLKGEIDDLKGEIGALKVSRANLQTDRFLGQVPYQVEEKIQRYVTQGLSSFDENYDYLPVISLVVQDPTKAYGYCHGNTELSWKDFTTARKRWVELRRKIQWKDFLLQPIKKR